LWFCCGAVAVATDRTGTASGSGPYYPVGVRTLCKALSKRGIPVEVGTWALFAAEVTRAVVADNLLGRATLALASITERLAPRLVLPLANYPMLIIGKDPPR
jgi:hypothetical protein